MEDTRIHKYYTPEIEEFHVGFEYEQVIDAKWEKCEMHLLDLGKVNNRLNSLRVKYLDREDIESLGFESVGKHTIQYEKDNCCIGWYDSKRMFIDIGDESYFVGTIKNKSQLKKILKQIGV